MTAQAIASDGVAAPGTPARRFGRAPLSVKLAIAFLGLVAFVLIVNGAIDTWLTYNQAKRAALEVEEEKARGAAERVGAFLSEIQTELGWTAGVEWGYAKLEQQRYDFIRLLRQAPAITALSYIDGHGKEQIAVSRLEPDSIGGGKDFSADPRFVRAVADKIWFGPVEFRRGSEPYMTIALAHVGKTPGVTVADVNLKLVWDVVSAIHVGEKGFAYVVDDRGRLIAHPDLSLVLRDSDLSHLPQVAMALAKQRSDETSASPVGSAETAISLDGASVLTAYAIAPKTHWAVFVEQPLAEALATAYRSLARSLALLGLGLALAAVSGVALARRMAAPIRLLQQGAEKLRAGDLSQRLDIRTGDEIEALAGSFNRMAGSLQESYETLEAKVDARTRDLEELLERQTATSTILEVIASSPADAGPVFEAIATSANAVMRGHSTTVFRIIEDRAHLMAFTPTSPEADAALRASFPVPLAEFSPFVFVNHGQSYQVADTEADNDPRIHDIGRARGFRSMIFTPLVHQGRSIGVIAVTRRTAGVFAPADVAQLRAFADQAVIAIQNARLFNETQKALERQTATAEILKVIASSPSDTQPVFETIVASAKRLLGARASLLTRFIGDNTYLAAFTPVDPEHDAAFVAAFPRPADDPITQALRTGRMVLVDDTESDDDWGWRDGAKIGIRSGVNVPLVSQGTTIGGLTVNSPEPGAFDPDDVELLRTFADQAVIAIENVRLLNDTKESLERQTATADVLKIISRSIEDAAPVFETILEFCQNLFDPYGAAIYLVDGDNAKGVARLGFEGQGHWGVDTTPLAGSSTGRAIADRRAVHLRDLAEKPDIPERVKSALTEMGGMTVLYAPMLSGERGVGSLVVTRRPKKPFSEAEIDFIQTFADQAVIAIENARLFAEVQAKTRDLEESLSQQTATADVLKVISRSAFDLDAIFQTLVASAVELCKASSGTVCVRDGDVFRYRGMAGPEASADLQRFLAEHPLVSPTRHTMAGRTILSGQAEEISDVLLEEEYAVPFASLSSPARALLGVPLLGKAEVQGAIVVSRSEPGAFPARHVEILRTFADQAVIAIENARLFEEVQAKTRDLEELLAQQTATADVLKVISRSAFDLQKVLDTLVGSARDLCAADSVALLMYEGKTLKYAAGAGMPSRMAERADGDTTTPDTDSLAQHVVEGRRLVHVSDFREHPEFKDSRAVTVGGFRAGLGVPMLRDGEVLGFFGLMRFAVKAFSAREIALAQTFVDQAQIAIENARLFQEVQARTRALEDALAKQTATAEILRVISGSPTDANPVFASIVVAAARLLPCDLAFIMLVEEKTWWNVAAATAEGLSPVTLTDRYPVDPNLNFPSRAIVGKTTAYLPDWSEIELPEHQVRVRALNGINASIHLPFLREGECVGLLTLLSQSAHPFGVAEIAQAESFRDQALIAIENSRLFNETQEALRQQIATASELEKSLADLRKTQDRLVQSEKLASLGQLTAGIAHEIKNPLNFVNNFASLSRELLEEMKETLAPSSLESKTRDDVDELMGMLDSNLEKVAHHGRRADSIVKNMLLHSREGSGERARVDVNAMVEEALNLGYHGARAEKPGFNVTIEKRFDPEAGEADLYLQEMTRVLLNLVSNGFYATAKRKQEAGADYQPTLVASTRSLGERVEIRVRDNGGGIPAEVRAKMFNPFFTTKPAGEGTGLGLSLSHDIVVKQHAGTIDVETEPGDFTEFIITLPRQNAKG